MSLESPESGEQWEAFEFSLDALQKMRATDFYHGYLTWLGKREDTEPLSPQNWALEILLPDAMGREMPEHVSKKYYSVREKLHHLAVDLEAATARDKNQEADEHKIRVAVKRKLEEIQGENSKPRE